MRETQFIKQNKEKWEEFEDSLQGEAKSANRLRDLFVQITDDLSYARTFYPNRLVRVYLNGLAQRVFTQLYRSKQRSPGVLLNFWLEDLPLEVYRARRAFLLALGLFALCFGIGMLSCAMDPEFAEVILSERYVEMTRANIESGDPMAVYKERGRFNMFLGITLNNVYVAFLAFSMGVFLGMGSIVILVSNAVMVGCFQYFFIKEGLFWDSFLTIWIHGTIEISAIVIATAAGITMGQGPAFPGTLTRLQAFQRSARRGAKIMLGTVPLFIIAGFLEGYLTRQTEISPVWRLEFILLCLAFVLAYFWWYPRFLHRLQGEEASRLERPLPPNRPYQLRTGIIRTNGMILGEAFSLFRKHSSVLLKGIFGSALAYVVLLFGLSGEAAAKLLPFRMSGIWNNGHDFVLLHSGSKVGGLLVPLLAGGVLYALLLSVSKVFDEEQGRNASSRLYGTLLFGAALMMVCVGWLSNTVILLLALVLPLALLSAFCCYQEEASPRQAIRRARALLKGKWVQAIALTSLLLLLGLALFSLANGIFIDLFFQLLNWFVTAPQPVLDEWSVRINTFFLLSIANFIWVMLLLGTGLLYFSLREIKEATGLKEKLSTIGQQKRIRGLEKE